MMPTLTAESVWHRYRQSGSRQLRDRLAKENDRLALKIAHRMSGQCAESIEDLAQIARIGLLKAIEKFDPDKGAAFSSFAVPYIQGEIQHYLRDHWGSVKIPRRTFETAAKVRKFQRQLGKLGRTVDAHQVAAALGMSKAKWQWVEQATQRKPLVSLEDNLNLAADDDPEETERSALHKELLRRVALLPKLKRECLIEHYFGQLGEEAIAKSHRITVDQVRSILQETLNDLQTQFQEHAPC